MGEEKMKKLQTLVGVLAVLAAFGPSVEGAQGVAWGPGLSGVPAPQATEALLSQNRVKVSVTWKNPYGGQTGTATLAAQGDEFAYFTFSTLANPEVFVKVLGNNEPGWLQLFAAGLTTFEYTVTFAACGATKTFHKAAYEKVTYDDGRGFSSSGCEPWSNETTVTLPGEVPFTVVRIPAGTFQMGSPATERGRNVDETLHQVTLTEDWYMAKTEVTQGQWQAVMEAPMSTECGDHGTGASYPVNCVSWDDIRGAGGFLDRLNAHLAATGQAGAGKFRLPTEAEWERAARGGTGTRFSFGDATAGSDSCKANAEANPFAWWCYNSGSVLQAAGTKAPNQYGLLDMHGNVFEWVEDWYGSYPAGAATNPTGPSKGLDKVFRGGGWKYYLDYCRSAIRYADSPSGRDFNIGFRPARSN